MFGGSFEKKESKGFEPLPKGRYLCVLENCTIEKSPTKGTPYLAMTCTILKGEYANRKIWHKIWFSEKAYDMAAQQLDNFGVFGEIKPSETIDGFCTNAADVVFNKVGGKVEIAVTGYNEFNDKTYENTFLTGDGSDFEDFASSADVDESESVPF